MSEMAASQPDEVPRQMLVLTARLPRFPTEELAPWVMEKIMPPRGDHAVVRPEPGVEIR